MNESIISSQPSHSPSNYAEMTCIAVVLLVGLPINIYVFIKLSQAYLSHATFSPFSLLKLHLNISDMLTMIFYAVSEMFWVATYKWHGGDLLCKLVKCLQVYPFYLSSYVILCIALDRLLTVRRMRRPQMTSNRVKWFLLAAWITSTFCSIPQFFVWKAEEFYPNFYQCTTTWFAKRIDHCKLLQPPKLCPEMYIRFPTESAYQVFHILSVFWLPATITGISYVLIRITFARCIAQKSAPASLDGLIEKSPTTNHEPSTPTEETGGAVGALRRASVVLRDAYLQRRASVQQRRLSAWAIQVRSHMTRQTITLISAYFLCWFPYNLLTVWELIDPGRFTSRAPELDWLYGLILVNAVINPFLYHFAELRVRPNRRTEPWVRLPLCAMRRT